MPKEIAMPQQTASNGDLAALVSKFTAQLEQLVRQEALASVQAALGGGGAGGGNAPSRRGRPAGKSAPRAATRGGRRSTQDMAGMSEKLLTHISANPGLRGEEISAALGTDAKTMRLPVLQLIEAGKIRTEGQRRGMKYFAGGRGGGAAAPGKAAGAKRASRKKGKRRGRKSSAKAGS